MSEENKNNVENNDASEVTYKKISFIKKVLYSITKFEKYPEMAAEGVPSALKYLSKIMLVFAIIISSAITIQLYQMINNGVNYIQNNLPDFYYKDGTLVVESEDMITINEANNILGKIIIDTNTEEQEKINQYLNSITNEEKGIIILKNKMIVKNLIASGETTYNYKDILNNDQTNIEELKKQDIIDFTNGKEIASFYVSFLILLIIYTFVMYLISVLIDSLILSALGYITTIIAKIRMKYAAIYNMSAYALTLSIILNVIYITVNMFTNFSVKYFQVMYTSVAYIYLVTAIFLIKTEFMKKQAELMKIIEEQEKSKKENQDDGSKEEKEKEKEPEEKNDEQKKDKKEKDKNNGEEPEGSNA